MQLNETIVSQAPRFLRYASYPYARHFTTVKALVKAIAGACRDTGFYDTKFIISLKRGRDCMVKTQRCATELHKYVSGFRFAILPTLGDGSGHSAGEIEVLPCGPFECGRFTFATESTRRFDELNGFVLQYSLPFKTRLEVLWDMWVDGTSRMTLFSTLSNIVEFDLVLEMARFTGSVPLGQTVSTKTMSYLI